MLLDCIRTAAMELLGRYVQAPAWNIREHDRQAELAIALRGPLDDAGGVRVARVLGGPNKFREVGVGAGLMTSRVHTELKVLFPPYKTSRQGLPKHDIVVLASGDVTLLRDTLGPSNFELAVRLEHVAAIIEIKAESLDWRGRRGAPEEHGARADFAKLKRLGRDAAAHTPDGAPPLLGMVVIDTGIPVGPLTYGAENWQQHRTDDEWDWPVPGADVDVNTDERVRVHLWSLDANHTPREWLWEPRRGWALVDAAIEAP